MIDSPSMNLYYTNAQPLLQARVTGITLSPQGVAVRMSFSTRRSRVNINWMRSKRLLSGSLIAITPTTDMFKSRTIPGVVAARSLEYINDDIPQVDMFFPYDAVIDPSIEYVILGETNGFFEAQRHNLIALQKMTLEP